MAGFISRHKVLWTTISSVVVGVFILWMTKAALLSIALSMKTGVSLSISDWSVGWRSMTFHNFRINTPSDPVYPTALSIGSIEIRAGLFDLMRKTSQVDSITINNVAMDINIRSNGSSNWSTPLAKFSAGSSSEKKKSTSYFVIENFALNNVTVALTQPGKGEKKFGPNSIQAKNLGSDRPMTLDGLVAFIASQVTSEIMKKYGLPNLLKGIIEAPFNILFFPFKKLFKKRSPATTD